MNNDAETFLTPELMDGRDWKGFELAVLRILEHCGWENLQYVGGAGDLGADILGVRYNRQAQRFDSYLFQVKAVTGGDYVATHAIDEAVSAQGFYHCRIAVVVTNGDFRPAALRRQIELNRLHFNLKLWNGLFLACLLSQYPERSCACRELRDYQREISDRVVSAYDAGERRGLFVVATGLGKTVIAADVVCRLFAKGLRRVLVLCHTNLLAIQLQRAFWGQVGRSMPTRLFLEGRTPVPIDGINFGLYQTVFGNLGGLPPGTFDLIVVDEAHHALARAFEACLAHLRPRFLVGMTATPWRGDGRKLEQVFGSPLGRMSLVDGMARHFLARVDYRLMNDNVNWEEVARLAHRRITVGDLNRRLFLPQRDDAVVSEIRRVMGEFRRPKVAVFSPSILHAERFARLLTANGIRTGCVTSGSRRLAEKVLLDFSSDQLEAITTVDMLNEGIDVPDINILVFLRATHSRRIFVQQLGRGLRMSKFKDHVVVLDFISDVRRLALVASFNGEVKKVGNSGDATVVFLKDGVVTSADPRFESFAEAWIHDVASLEDRTDAEKLEFPNIEELGL